MGLTIGVDIGGTKIAAGVVDDEGTLLATTRRDTAATDPEQIEVQVEDAVAELRVAHQIEAVGVAAAGFVNSAKGIVLFAPNLAWRDEPLGGDLQLRLGLPVVVENDANAAAWGEFRFGAAKHVDDMVLLTVGTGLGGGIVSDSQLLRGASGLGAELGHVRVVPNGIRCGCGNRGCWEQYSSGSALEREARELVASGSLYAARLLELCEGKPKRLRGKMVTQAAHEGDPASVELIGDLGRWLGEGMASMAAVLDPSAFVVGGGVVEAGDLLIEPARTALRRNLPARGHRPDIEVTAASLGNQAGMIGVADLARLGVGPS
jgi:glucokinase